MFNAYISIHLSFTFVYYYFAEHYTENVPIKRNENKKNSLNVLNLTASYEVTCCCFFFCCFFHILVCFFLLSTLFIRKLGITETIFFSNWDKHINSFVHVQDICQKGYVKCVSVCVCVYVCGCIFYIQSNGNVFFCHNFDVVFLLYIIFILLIS